MGSSRLLRGVAVAATLMLAVLVLILAWPLLSDLPRRWVESTLSDALGAEVSLGRFIFRGWSEFELRDLTIRKMESRPELVEARVLELWVEAGPRDLLARRFSRVDLEGVSLRLAPPQRPAVAAEPSDVRVGVLGIRDGTLLIDGADSVSSLPFQGLVRDLGGNWSATLDAGSDLLDTGALAELARQPDIAGKDEETLDTTREGADLLLETVLPTLVGFHLGALLTHEGSWEVSAATEKILLPGPDRERSLGFSTFEGRGELQQDGSWTARLRPRLPGLTEAKLDLLLAPSTFQLRKADLALRGLDLALWLPLLAALPPGASLDGEADVEIVRSEEEGWSYSVRGELSRGSLRLADQPVLVHGSTLQVSGRLSLEGRGPLRADLALSGLTAEGLSRDLGEMAFPMTASLDGEVAWAETVSYSGRLRSRTRQLGELSLEGSIGNLLDSPVASASWEWSGSDLVDLDKGLALLPEGSPRVEGRISATGSLTGAVVDPAIRGEVALEKLRAAAEIGPPNETAATRDRSTVLEAERLVLPFRRAPGTWRIDWNLLGAPVLVALPPIEPILFQAAAEGSIDPAAGQLRINDLQLASAGVGSFSVSALADGAGAAEVQVNASQGDLSRWIDLMRPLLGEVVLPSEVHGGLSGLLSSARTPQGVWTAQGEMLLEQAGASSADGARVVDGLALRARLSGDAAPGAPWRCSGNLLLTGPQLLWESVFADYSHLRLGLDFQGSLEQGTGTRPAGSWNLQGQTDGLEGLDLEWETESDGSAGGGFDFALKLEATDLGALAEQWIKKPLGDGLPALAELEVNGLLSARLTGRRHQEGFDLSGEIDLSEAAVRRASGFTVEGLALKLPYELHWPLTETAHSGEPMGSLPGGLSFDSISAGTITLAPTSTDLIIQDDSIELRQSLQVPLLGGTVILESLTLAQVLRPSRRLEAAVRLQDIRLEEATAGLEGLPLAGEVGGYFPRMRLGMEKLEVDGDAELSVFGGRVVVSDISGRDLFSRFPQLQLSAAFQDIDLAQLTGRFDFGEMTGHAEGRLKDLELFRGSPVRFQGWVASVEKPHVRRTISVKAVSNVAQLAGGGGVSVLERGAYRFLDRYTYRSFGFAMVLNRDHFLMRGLERRGGRELFVKGRPPFSLDMVNVEPGRTVSFSTMLERISNLEVQR